MGILSPVNIKSVAAVLGCLKAGCAYVPLDEASPPARLQKIIEAAQLKVILNHHHWIDVDEYSSDFIVSSPQVSDNLAYILHTSGSTGVPKGIMLTHRNARTFVDWMHKEFCVTPDDIIMSRAPFKFDLSVFDIFNTLKAGAKLICYDTKGTHSDYVHLIEKSRATILYTTPSTFITLMNRGGLGEKPLSLSRVMYAGEPFPVPQLRRMKELLPNIRIANIYGPTETNIITYYWVDSIGEDEATIPLGYVVDDTEILIVNENQVCQPGEIGELWCRGGTVTLGYLGMPEKSREHLVQSPFHSYPCFFWRTGDYGFKDENGLLHYRGRRDHMVKVKGYRIELGEIEQALAKHESLDEYAVVAVPDEKYGNRLYCFYSLLLDHQEIDLKHFLTKSLPEPFLPYAFIRKKVMPKTSSGKIDRIHLIETL